MPRRRPVITGIGIICAAGCGVDSVWQSIRENQSSLRPLTRFASPRYGQHLVGQVNEDVDALAGVRGSRTDKLAWIAAREALVFADWEQAKKKISPGRVGVMVGSTVGGMAESEQFLSALLRENKRRFGPLRFHEPASAADLCARQMAARGPVSTISTACSAGAMAILAAGELIEQGEADLMLAGGADALSRLTLNGFGSLLLLDPNGCRPFDARRTGISLGEGAAMLVLEAEETARARGAQILARLGGWGTSCDAFHATAPRPDGSGALAAMRQAIQRAGVSPEEIDFVSAHGTATPDNDVMEAQALKTLFGNRPTPFSSVKRFFGHTLAASGAIKAALAVQSLREQAVPGTPGFEQVDPKIGLEPVREYRQQRVERILSNSFGFGGNNVALVFEHLAGNDPRPEHLVIRPSKALAIVGIGVVSAGGCSAAEVAATFKNGDAASTVMELPAFAKAAKVRVYASREFDGAGIEPGKRRKLSRIQQMTLSAAKQALSTKTAIPPERVAVAIGTGLGSLNDTAGFVENMILKDERVPRPALFTSSVHNALAAQVAIEEQFAGLNTTPVQREITFETALWQAATELTAGRADVALAGAVDELNAHHLATGARWGWWSETSPEIRPFGGISGTLPSRSRPILGEGCAVFALKRSEDTDKPLAHVSAIRIGRSEQFDPEAEAAWIRETLERDGISPSEVDHLLTGANGWGQWDDLYQAIATAFSRLVGRKVPCSAYKQGCGEFYSASAFGLLAAVGLIRGEISPKNLRIGTVNDEHARSAGLRPGSLAADFQRAVPETSALVGSADTVKSVVLLTLSPTGTKGMCCIRA